MKVIRLIAEIGMTHNGDLSLAKQMAQVAIDSGADAVKFQYHIAEAETTKNAPAPAYFQKESRFDYFKRTEFSLDEWKELKSFIESGGAQFVISPFSEEAVEQLEKMDVRFYKIPSGEVTNTPMLKLIASKGKRCPAFFWYEQLV